MDTIVTTAIIGTGQQSNPDRTTGTPIDDLATQLAPDNLERNLLLTAGAWAVYHEAGRVTQQALAAPPPSSPETLPACTATVANHLANMFLEHKNSALLPEALDLLKQARQRIPHHLLPQALTYSSQHKEIRPALAYVLGERGYWLSQFNSAWAWVTQYRPLPEEITAANVETIWQEGTTIQREEILRQVRSTDPTKARDWLTTAWKQEKVEARAAFLATFEVQLSLADEPFLEKALDDRGESVRTTAASLLARLPGSALVKRMQTRADVMLDCQKSKASLASLLTHQTKATLLVNFPLTHNAEWQRDGIAAKAPVGIGEKAWWLSEVLARVPVTHWESRFSLSPEQLIAAASATDWSAQLIEGWSRAALLHEQQHWIAPLWDWWHTQAETHTGLRATTPMKQALGRHLTQQDAEDRVTPQFSDATRWQQDISILPTPWSQSFAETCLQALRKHVQALHEQTKNTYLDDQTVTTIATAIPPACFDAALAPWDIPENDDNWQIRNWRQHLHILTELLSIRKSLLEEFNNR